MGRPLSQRMMIPQAGKGSSAGKTKLAGTQQQGMQPAWHEDQACLRWYHGACGVEQCLQELIRRTLKCVPFASLCSFGFECDVTSWPRDHRGIPSSQIPPRIFNMISSWQLFSEVSHAYVWFLKLKVGKMLSMTPCAPHWPGFTSSKSTGIITQGS